MQVNAQISSVKRPVFLIGAGGIVNDAHLPAYKIAGFDVQGIFDIVYDKAKATAGKFNVGNTFTTLEEMLSHAPGNAVFDVAIPGAEIIPVLKRLPAGSPVLLQKPMGEN